MIIVFSPVDAIVSEICSDSFLAGNRIHITTEHASSTVGKKRGRGKLEPAIPGMTIQIPKSTSGDISQSDSESDHNIASKMDTFL